MSSKSKPQQSSIRGKVTFDFRFNQSRLIGGIVTLWLLLSGAWAMSSSGIEQSGEILSLLLTQQVE